jgi:hypothetical protein
VSAPRTLGEWLRAAHADPAAGCPPPESWLADELTALAPGERRRLEAHAAECPACSAERELAAAFDAGAAEAAADDVAWVTARLAPRPAAGNAPRGAVVAFPGRRARSGAVRWLRLAAAAVLVVAAGLVFQTLNLSHGPLPEPPAGGPVRGGSVEVVAPLGEQPALPAELRWRPLPGAAGYRVRLLAADGTELWREAVTTPTAALPPAVMARLHRAVSYGWNVEALAADGRVIARSETVTFRAAPEPETPAQDEPRED